MVAESASIQNRDGAKLLEEVLDALWRNFDYVGESRMRKAVAMGGNHQVLDRFDGEINVLGEVQTSQDQNGTAGVETGLSRWQDEHSTLWADIQDTPEGVRRVTMEDNDPAFAMPLKDYVIRALHQAQTVGLGPYWDKADQNTRQSLEKFLA
ncbi:hypothetical protein IAU60_001115 [Kwoniella sp. DSM 27419]